MNTQYQTIIIGGGLSGLTVAHNLLQQAQKHRFLVLEKSARTGGAIKTHHDCEYITEIGPHGFLDNCRESKQLLKDTGLDEECVKAPLIDFVRYVYLRDKLNLIPQTPGKIFMAPIISWPAKLRVLAEIWQPVLKGEPTVAKWVTHRFGPALLPFIDAIYTGTYAGDYDRLTIDSVMPGIRALEKEYGSILRGLLKKTLQRKKRTKEKTKLRMPAMTSFPSGMQRLSDRLTESLSHGENLLTGTVVTAIHHSDNRWQVHTNKKSYQVKNIVLALPVNEALRLLGSVCADIPQKSIPQARIATVVSGFKNSVSLPPGFGFLTPETEKRFCLGALFSSNMFPGRAPEGHIVFETLVGGRRHPERLDLDDQTLTRLALKDVQQILSIREKPTYTTVLRSESGIPQLEQHFPALLKWKQESEKKHKGLHICGFGWGGIGINDMIKDGTEVAVNITTPAPPEGSEPEIKGVYF